MKKYYIEWTGEHWQSVFPSDEERYSQLHTTIEDAFNYIQSIKPRVAVIIPAVMAHEK